MKEIDLSSWARREHFSFFRRADLPFYNVSVNVDVTGLRDTARKRRISFNTLLIYLTVRAMNRVENLRYRCRGDAVVLHERLHPSFAHLKEGEELFRLITVDFADDLLAFDQLVKAEIAKSTHYFNLEKLAGRDDFVFISSLPWVSFTSVDHTLSLKRDDGIPRVSWGKCFDADGKTQLPYNIQVNHMFVDGIHVGRFFDALASEIGHIRPGII
ncbi:MAG: chloramphenicol acetyltransferase [Proteobacteria bacterium]|nr:chloramphenicol acetyltransferase [Pseudomonadota bacterium]